MRVSGRRRLEYPLAVLCTVLFCTAAQAQHADPIEATLEWRRGETARACLDAHELRRRVRDRLGRTVFTDNPSVADVRVRGSIDATEAGFRTTIELVDPEGQSLGVRELSSTATDCSNEAGPISLIVAMMLNVPREELGLAVREPTRPFHVEPRLGGRYISGFLPGAAFAITGGVLLDPGVIWPIVVEGAFWLPKKGQTDGAGAEFGAFEGSVGTCPRLLTVGALDAHFCFGAWVSRVRPEAFGLDVIESDVDRLAAGAFGTVLGRLHAFGPLTFGLEAGLRVPFIRRKYTFEDRDGSRRFVHRYWRSMPTVSLIAGLDL